MIHQTEKQEKSSVTRPPIVVVMGHIDHGKTKILDWYRKTKVVEQESGGITQHIGAYSVDHKGKKITFIDTPGHEAFSKLRSRGARAADIAILVVAADEGVKPQTKEAIEIIQANELPFIVALNKVDKPEAHIDRVKQQLAEASVLVETYGGKVPSVEISAKAGTHMDDLLEVILLIAELENLEAHPEKSAEGVVIEAHRDPQRGNTATLLIVDGTLKKGGTVVIGRSIETAKILEDFLGKNITEAYPSDPVVVAGLTKTPVSGDPFFQCASRHEAEEKIAALPEIVPVAKSALTQPNGTKQVFNIILKADVVGSKEALEESLRKFESPDVGINILRSEVGDINESDVKLAMATKLVTIVGFKVRFDSSVRELARTANTRIVVGEVIYEVLDQVKQVLEDMLPPEIRRTDLGKIKILKVFSTKGGSSSGGKKEGTKQIVGGRVEEGSVKRGAHIEIKRMRELLGRGVISELQRDKVPQDMVEKGHECGMLVDSKTAIEVGDVLEVFEEEVIKRKL